MGESIPLRWDARDLWNFVTEMALSASTVETKQRRGATCRQRLPALRPARTASASTQAPGRDGGVCTEHPLGPVTLFKAIFKTCPVSLCSPDAYRTTKRHSLKRMTRSLAYKTGNPGILYCKPAVTWRDLAVVMGTSTCKWWWASATSQRMTRRASGQPACPPGLGPEGKGNCTKLLLILLLQLGSCSKWGPFPELHCLTGCFVTRVGCQITNACSLLLFLLLPWPSVSPSWHSSRTVRPGWSAFSLLVFASSPSQK